LDKNLDRRRAPRIILYMDPREGGQSLEQIPGQMSIYECIEVASDGSDGKPPAKASPSRRRTVADIVRDRLAKGADVIVQQDTAQRIAHEATDDLVEAVESAMGVELGEAQWEQVTGAIEADLTESIVDSFGELG
jgi:hypothetical protein